MIRTVKLIEVLFYVTTIALATASYALLFLIYKAEPARDTATLPAFAWFFIWPLILPFSLFCFKKRAASVFWVMTLATWAAGFMLLYENKSNDLQMHFPMLYNLAIAYQIYVWLVIMAYIYVVSFTDYTQLFVKTEEQDPI